jgi:hypothetical protein
MLFTSLEPHPDLLQPIVQYVSSLAYLTRRLITSCHVDPISSLVHHSACWEVKSSCALSRMHPNFSICSSVSLPFSRKYNRVSEIPILGFLDQQEKLKISSALSRPSQTTMRSTKCLVDEISGQSASVLPCFVFVACSYLRIMHLQSIL